VKGVNPELLIGLGVCVGIVPLACPVLIGYGLAGRGPDGEWRRPLWGIRGTSTDGLGLSLMAFVVFLRVRPSAVTAGGRWVLLAGLVAAAAGQALVVASLFTGALSPPAPGERLFPRKYCMLVPVATFMLLCALWGARGLH